MIYSELNLLSPAKKARLRSLIKFLFLREHLELFVLTVTLLAIMHLVGWLMLSRLFSDLAASTLLINRDFANYNQEIRRLNQLVKTLDRSSRDFVLLSPILWELASILPATVELHAITVDRVAGQLVLLGTAKTRETLLTYQSQLGALSWLKEVNAPPSQLLQKENIDFKIRAALDHDLALTPPAGRAKNRVPVETAAVSE